MSEPPRVVVVRYGEIGLKGGNRAEFERRLQKNLRDALADHDVGAIRRPHGRLLVQDAGDAWRAAERAARVFGVTSASPAWSVPPAPDAIVAAGVTAVEATLRRRGRPDGAGLAFRAESRRSDKRFPLRSMELSRLAAEAVLERFGGFTVRMKGADVTLGIEVRADEALVFAERMAGPGGLPVGSLGSAVVLFSGGIDSPVAAWLAMKRGLRVALLHFHAAPFVGDASKEKAIDLARALSRFGGALALHVVPFADVQVAIKQGAPAPFRTLLYRRAMNRIAARLAGEIDAAALITGESLGQVASQTLENLACIEDTADRLVLRPLVTHDKGETIALARKIGTLEISARPHPDCCTLFMPEKPKIRARLAEVRAIDGRLALDPLLAAAWEQNERILVREGEILTGARATV